MRHAAHTSAGPAPAIDGLLKRWLHERQQLLSHYCSLSELLSRKAVPAALSARLDRFCEVLVDYVSAGHFEVYRELLDANERRGPQARAESAALYRLIVPTTTIALDFNDRYFRGPAGHRLRQDLSRLGQVLASRFDWEDALIGPRDGQRAVA
jgi:regulator of sigma D